MRKGLILLLFISTSVLAYPDINSKYEQGPYVFESSRVNTKGKEIALSDYKDGKIVYKQVVPEITEEPNYDEALNAAIDAANRGASCCGFCQ